MEFCIFVMNPYCIAMVSTTKIARHYLNIDCKKTIWQLSKSIDFEVIQTSISKTAAAFQFMFDELLDL